MEYRRLGKSGLNVSEIGLGVNTFGWYVDESTATAIVNRALELGINYIDTADWYAQGRSEEVVGKVVKEKRTQFIIATKVGLPMGEGPNDRGCSRFRIIKAVDASLKRLNTDYIDLYQLHAFDPTTPLEETLQTLDTLVRSGKVRYIGCCNFAAWQVAEALWTSRINNLEPFITVQQCYNLIEREIEKELVPCCQAHGIGIVPWGPLAGGFLTGKYRKGAKPAEGSRFSYQPRLYSHIYSDEANYDRLTKLEAFATERGHKINELAIAWLLSHPWVSTVIAGATKPEHVTANASGVEWKLTKEEISQLDELDKPEPGKVTKYEPNIQTYKQTRAIAKS